MKKRIFLAILVVLVIFGTLAGVRVLQVQAMIEAGENFAPPPVAVDVKTAQREDWVELLGAVGTVNAIEGITVRSTLSGVVERIAFQPGTRVETGDLLIELDRGVEEANLLQAEADLDLAERQLLRARGLIKSDTISISDLDDAVARQAEAAARVASLRATLDKKTIHAPFTGELGIKQISLGQYLNPGDPVVELQALDQVFVQFSLPQQHLPALVVGLDVQVTSNAYEERTFDGTITAVNPQIDPSTRNVMVQATFDNPQHQLRSGMYVSVDVILPETRSLVTIPATSVLYACLWQQCVRCRGTNEHRWCNPTRRPSADRSVGEYPR